MSFELEAIHRTDDKHLHVVHLSVVSTNGTYNGYIDYGILVLEALQHTRE